jgi:hypothetical protein
LQDYNTVRNGGVKVLELLSINNVYKVLNDNSKVVGNRSDASDEGRTIWFPAMSQAGLRYFAWIQSPQLFSQLSALNSLNAK